MRFVVAVVGGVVPVVGVVVVVVGVVIFVVVLVVVFDRWGYCCRTVCRGILLLEGYFKCF